MHEAAIRLSRPLMGCWWALHIQQDCLQDGPLADWHEYMPLQKEIWAAAGTVFLDVLIWCFSIDAVSQDGIASAPPWLRLTGHEGSIHRQASVSQHALAS